MALKLLRRDSVLRTTFLREFCVGRCVSSHPGLLRTLVGPLQTPRHFAFAQEYAPYGDLSGMLQERVRDAGDKGGAAEPTSSSAPRPSSISQSDSGISAQTSSTLSPQTSYLFPILSTIPCLALTQPTPRCACLGGAQGWG